MICWLVETRNPTRFVTVSNLGLSWTFDATEALRLARREDGEMVGRWLGFIHTEIVVCEHEWIDL